MMMMARIEAGGNFQASEISIVFSLLNIFTLLSYLIYSTVYDKNKSL
jgi:hypothetical protein